MTTLATPRLTLPVCTLDHLDALIAGAAAFEARFNMKVIEGYLEFPEALTWMQKQLQAGADPAWWSYLVVHTADKALIGLAGYKGAPDVEGMVEIGYGISPAYRGEGYATEAAQGLIDAAFTRSGVQKVWAHTLAQPNASTHVLQKCGLVKIAEFDDPDDGLIWRWERLKAAVSA